MKYVFDIDDTILFSEVDENGNYNLINANLDLIKVINVLYQDGHEIILWTGRHWNHLDITKKQLKKYCVCCTTLIMGKPVADFYVDDKSIKPEEFLNGRTF